MGWPDEKGKRKRKDRLVERSSCPALLLLVGKIPGTCSTRHQERKSLAISTPDPQRTGHRESFNDNSFLLTDKDVGNLTYSKMIDLSDIRNRLCPDLQRYPRGYN